MCLASAPRGQCRADLLPQWQTLHPNLNPHRLSTLVRIHFNKKTFMPSKQAIRERYSRKYHKAGQSHNEEDEMEFDATAEASTD